ncbi:actin-related protein 5 [Diretmus argenteus]
MASKVAPVCQIFTFQDCKTSPDPIYEISARCLSPSPLPIVIDNGSFQTRAGWAGDAAEFEAPKLLFKSVAARSRGAARSETQIGNDISNLEPLRWLLKSQFDRNVVVNFEIQELIFDYVFTHLGVASEGSVEHPVVLSEAPCNPLHCRQMMSELLFECYRVPHVSYGVDGLYSYYCNNAQRKVQPMQTGIVLSSGYHCSHILPVINGRMDAANCKRVNVGGSQAASYLQRLLQLKYPGHLAAITLSRMEELLHEHSYTATDYHEELEKWRSPEFYEREVHRMQLPFSAKVLGGGVSVEERHERRAQQLRRLQEINARRRGEKLQQDQQRLDKLLAVQELLEDGIVDQFHRNLVELNMDSAEELQSYINKLHLAVEQGRQKLLHSDGAEGKTEVSELEPPMDEGDAAVLMDPDFTEDSLPEKPPNVVQPVFNMAEYHQLFVGTERLRCPEILFQPSLTGEDQMGLMETLQYVLARYTPEQQEALVSNVFLTGGNMQYPGMKQRVERELLTIRPFQSHFQVTMASHLSLDAWYGARAWALEHLPGGGGGEPEGWISRQDYEEKGGEYLSEHCASNVFVPMKIVKPAPSRPAEPAPVGMAMAASPASTGFCRERDWDQDRDLDQDRDRDLDKDRDQTGTLTRTGTGTGTLIRTGTGLGP